MNQANNGLQTLFAGSSNDSGIELRQFCVLSRHAQPLLYLPPDARCAKVALSLYPAQRPSARFFKRILNTACKAGIIRLLPKTKVQLKTHSPLSRFLAALIAEEATPQIAVLCGNPHTVGQRFTILVFRENAMPAFVVKAGATPAAKQLIRQEATFLQSAPTNASGLPRIRDTLENESVCALVTDFVDGNSPPPRTADKLSKLLCSWIDTAHQSTVTETPLWRQLMAATPASPLKQKLGTVLGKETIHRVLYHGDFAPWNIRRSSGPNGWTVLDWERGQLVGLPCWDWFHYNIQVGILVDHQSTEAHVRKIETWLEGNTFEQYSRAASAWSIRRPLLLAYLLYCRDVLKPSEGRSETSALLDALSQRWTDSLDRGAT